MKTTIAGAIRVTLKEEMEKDEFVFLLGEDIASYGGIHNVTKGLLDTFGANRVIDTPLSECVIAGCGVGAAIAGMRPVVEIMYADFLPLAMDQIINNAAKTSYLTQGADKVPLVIRSNFGTGKGQGPEHSQSPESWFFNVPGLKIAIPSTPADARGLLQSSIRDNNPVLFLEHKMLYQLKGEIDVDAASIPLGEADVKREGKDVTIVTSGLMVHKSLEAAKRLAEEKLDVEVIDIRTLSPLDDATIQSSVAKTRRLMVVEEGPRTGGWGGEIVDRVVKFQFNDLVAAPMRVASMDVPLPAETHLEDIVVPNVDDIMRAARAIVNTM